MRTFEILLLTIATLFPFFLTTAVFRKHKLAITSIIILVLLCNLFLEGFRWQLIPGLIIILLSIIFYYKEIKLLKGSWMSYTLKLMLLSLLLVIAWGLPIIFPVFELPTPTGDYKIGSRYAKVTTDRPEIITQNTKDVREFMVKIWYPAEIKKDKKESYLDKGNRLGFVNKYNLPKFTLDHLDYIETNTYTEPDLAKGKFPVLIFSHGLHSEAYGYYSLMEEIVSHGFVVININHTYESSGSLFPDRDIKYYNSEFDRKTNDSKMAEMAWNSLENYNKATTDSKKLKAVEDLIKNYVAADITKRWSADISTVIDKLDTWNKNSFLTNHLDMNKIGVFGHSQGGSAVGQALLDDKRIDAGINLDGAQWGNMIDKSFSKPFLLISSEWPESHMGINKFSYRNLSSSTFHKHIVKNSGHSNFMDIPLMINFSYVNEAGEINPFVAYKETTNLIINFFNKNLNDN